LVLSAIRGRIIRCFWSCWENDQEGSISQIDRSAIDIIKILCRKERIEPLSFWRAGLRLFEKINQTFFRQLITPYIAIWQRAGWERIAATLSFNLVRSLKTISSINQILSTTINDRSFLAKLFLVTSEAVGVSLTLAYRDSLRSVAEEE